VDLLGYDMGPYDGGPVGGIAGSTTPMGTACIYFRVQGGNRMLKETFAVFDDICMDMILGIGFLTKYRVISIDVSALPIRYSG
jgi:hypothetical protein